jgi:predicted RNA-binding protein with RPS1 domain
LKESPKRYKNANSSNGSISKEYLIKNYNEHFIKNIFGRHTFQVQEQSMLVDDEFKDTLSFRKTDEFEEEQRRQEKKYKNLTSIQFERSPRKIPRMKVNTRKF